MEFKREFGYFKIKTVTVDMITRWEYCICRALKGTALLHH